MSHNIYGYRVVTVSTLMVEVDLTETELTVSGTVTHEHPDIVEYMREVDEDERLEEYKYLVRLGAVCAERASRSSDVEFVRSELRRMLREVDEEVGDIPGETLEKFEESLSAEDGKVLAPIKAQVEATKEQMNERIVEVEELIENELDPQSDESDLGRVLTKMENLLDSDRKDSIPHMTEELVEDIAAQDGELVETVEATVNETLEEELEPLREEISGLRDSVIEEEALEEIVERTTLKGETYEDRLEERLRQWANTNGADVERVGDDGNPGDILVNLPPGAMQAETRLVVEAKNDEKGRADKRLGDAAEDALEERQGDAYVFSAGNANALGKTVPDLTQGRTSAGPWVACTHEHLVSALRLAELKVAERRLHEAQPEVDTQRISEELDRLQSKTEHLKNIKSKASDISDARSAIEDEADEMREEIRDILANCRSAIREAASVSDSGSAADEAAAD